MRLSSYSDTELPTVILAATIKGYGLGEGGEGRNITHQQKKMNEKELRKFRARFGIPISDEEVADAPFTRPAPDSREMKYLHERRRELGGSLPKRQVEAEPLQTPRLDTFGPVVKGSSTEISTTMASFVAAGTAYATHATPMIPFYIYYSMFGFQRVGDLMWLAGDIRAKGFLLAATAGRTSLNGEGLQHQDGHSHLAMTAIPTLLTYDAAFGYEVATIIAEGMRRMYEEGEELFYYLTLYKKSTCNAAFVRITFVWCHRAVA